MADDPRDLEQRPSPDALLAEVRREEKGRAGRLKIFVGAAPGVGKTYEMLQAARAKLKEGVDVVVGVVETHGRKETEALLDGLEMLARRPVVHAGTIMSEFDLDRALKRRPGLILVDELAHTNLPGSRHPKRYQDVEELLDAGLDVYTTVNIQHIESLNDIVAQITRVRVREIVPDSVLDRANDIELVDLTPDDLIQRLKEGKVYVPKQAERALKNYFSPANLTALRELALRRTAERVDEQLLEQMQARAIQGSVGRRRAHPRLRQRGSPRRITRAPHEASGRPPARAVDGIAHRNQTQPPAQRGRTGSRRGDFAAGRTPGG